jgi:putative transposase
MQFHPHKSGMFHSGIIYNQVMPNFHRYYIPGALIFITCVTKDRKPYLKDAALRQIYWDTVREVQKNHPFHLLAYVILPDHFHWLMQMPGAEANFSKPLGSLKRNFTINLKHFLHVNTELNVWQPRFWDHIIRNETDLDNHLDYIHWNPVKHGYVIEPEQWPDSTFLHWMTRGYYPEDWGKANDHPGIREMEYE